jgi:hypothetical protein
MFGKEHTIGRIELFWEYPPEMYDIFFMIGGAWQHFMEIYSTKMEFIAEFAPMMSTGCMLKMKKFDIRKSTFFINI